jgi:hypothetical protein
MRARQPVQIDSVYARFRPAESYVLQCICVRSVDGVAIIGVTKNRKVLCRVCRVQAGRVGMIVVVSSRRGMSAACVEVRTFYHDRVLSPDAEIVV